MGDLSSPADSDSLYTSEEDDDNIKFKVENIIPDKDDVEIVEKKESSSEFEYYEEERAEGEESDDDVLGDFLAKEKEQYAQKDQIDTQQSLIDNDTEYYRSADEDADGEEEEEEKKEPPLTDCISYVNLNNNTLDAAANAVVDSYATSLEYTFNNTSNDPYDIAEEYLPVQNNAPLPFDENGEQSLNAIAEQALYNNLRTTPPEEPPFLSPPPCIQASFQTETTTVFANNYLAISAIPSVLPPPSFSSTIIPPLASSSSSQKKQQRKRKAVEDEISTTQKTVEQKKRKLTKTPLKKFPLTKVAHLERNDEGHSIENSYEISIVCPNNTNTLYIRVSNERVNSKIRTIILPFQSLPKVSAFRVKEDFLPSQREEEEMNKIID